MSENSSTGLKAHSQFLRQVLPTLLFILVLVVGFLFRSYNLSWDLGTHLHPDERFLSQVESAIQPVQSLGEYFDTDTSTLNPHNVGHGFFVYGTLPVFIIRYLGELTGQVGYDPITALGRQLSVLTELITICLVFLIGRKLKNEWLGLIAAAFYALSVVPIQQSHFMTVDTFTNTFGMLTVYAGVLILKAPLRVATKKISAQDLGLFLFFGLALGMATASKANAVTLALVLPVIVYVRHLNEQNAGLTPTPFLRSLLLMGIAGFTSFIVFRIFQPYAFSGPGFFNFSLNPKWLANIRELSAAASGLGDAPPALQWARRSILFGPYNLAFWGMGLPFAIMAIAGFIGLIYQGIKKRVYDYFPILAWTLFYFLWQTSSWTPSMRYYLLVYPLFGLTAGWACIKLWRINNPALLGSLRLDPKRWVWLGRSLVILALIGTGLWAYAFSRTYAREFTRVATSRWIYQNIQGSLTFTNKTADAELHLPMPFPAEDSKAGTEALRLIYSPDVDQPLSAVFLPAVYDLTNKQNDSLYTLEVFDLKDRELPLSPPAKAQTGGEQNRNPNTLRFALPAISLQKGHDYLLEIRAVSGSSVNKFSGTPSLEFPRSDGSLRSFSLPRISTKIEPGAAQRVVFTAMDAGEITELKIPYILDYSQSGSFKTLDITIRKDNAPESFAQGKIQSDFLSLGDGMGTGFTAAFEPGLKVDKGQNIIVEFSLSEGLGSLGINAPFNVIETSWDDALPVFLPGFLPYNNEYSAFQSKNLDMYAYEDENKRDRLVDSLAISDNILMSSNRVWGTTVRVPERYPLATLFYKELMGCPDGMDIVQCYNDAETGRFEGRLGFTLVNTDSSYPNLGGIRFNDQYAEEAFTVYDHPKTFVFVKNERFDIEKVKDLFDQVDLSKVVQITPKQADSYKPNTSLDSQFIYDAEIWKIQREGGTWSELFDRDSPINKSQILSVIALYGLVTVLGWAFFPLMRVALGGLTDRGFVFGKIAALLCLAYLVFIAGNYGLDASRLTISLALAVLLLINALIAYFTRKSLVDDLKRLAKQYLILELIALIAFAFFLWVRWQNPDLWHPWKGGEKPMDFSFWNAVLKSSRFPAYNPWFSGEFLNYYYYGFVVLAMPVKLLGIVPAIAYNIILPIWYSLVFVGVFSLAWNLMTSLFKQARSNMYFGSAFWAGLWSALLMVLLGNLGAIRLFKETLEKMGSAGADLNLATGLEKLAFFFAGLVQYFKGSPLPLYPGDWYWIPSRMIPGEPITEFPYFTFLYADLHAHLMVMPVATLSLAWALSYLYKPVAISGSLKTWILRALAVFGLGGLTLGALKPINTWDFYTYPILAAIVLIYSEYRLINAQHSGFKSFLRNWPAFLKAGLLIALSVLLYKPFNDLFRPGYNKIALWEGARTPLRSYTGHWGVFLFILAAFLLWELYFWLRTTHVSQLERLKPHTEKLAVLTSFLVFAFIGLLLLKVQIAVLAFPLALLALFLLIVDEGPSARKLIYFMIGTALLLTIVVELIWPEGDNGRQNSVFKLYLQAWTLFSVVSGPALLSIWKAHKGWKLPWQVALEVPLILLLAGAAFFPVMATLDKTKDRMDRNAPKTLDGMKYMESSSYLEPGTQDPQREAQILPMELKEDYDAIIWMQENVKGSPVILEAQAYEYRWGNRFTIYTGLPGVVGWNYHQRQQHSILADNRVQARVDAVNDFYNTQDLKIVQNILDTYQVEYIIVGQLEARFYTKEGLAKFTAQDGKLWDMVYNQGQTRIFKVKP